MKKFGGSPKCGICGKSAYPAESTRINDVIYHHVCLKCCQCGKPRLGPLAVITADKKVYCRLHAPGQAKREERQAMGAARGAGPKEETGLKMGEAKVPLSKIVFDKYDTNKNGSINLSDFGHMCMELGAELTPEQLETALRVLDKDGNGTIEYDEFLPWWQKEERMREVTYTEEQLVYLHDAFEKFVSFDKDSNGTIDKQEFVDMHAYLVGEGYAHHDPETDWDEMNPEGYETISFSLYAAFIEKQAKIKPDPSALSESGAKRVNPFLAEMMSSKKFGKQQAKHN